MKVGKKIVKILHLKGTSKYFGQCLDEKKSLSLTSFLKLTETHTLNLFHWYLLTNSVYRSYQIKDKLQFAD